MARRVLTKESIDQLLASGTTEVRLAPGDIVTALAKEYALDHGLRLVPAPVAAAPSAHSPAAQPPAQSSGSAGVGAEVRKAVVAALGYEPDGLDSAINKALKK